MGPEDIIIHFKQLFNYSRPTKSFSKKHEGSNIKKFYLLCLGQKICQKSGNHLPKIKFLQPKAEGYDYNENLKEVGEPVFWIE